MKRRASVYQAAEQVQIAVALARNKASATLIESLTHFGVRWIRRTIRQNDGALALKSRDARWLERDPKRLLQAVVFLRAYEQQPSSHLPGRRLLDAYAAYSVFAGTGTLDINRCAQIVQLRQSKEARERTCSECRISHLVVCECALCPICRLIERSRCRGCGAQLPSDSVHSRRYCADCSPRSVRLRRKRKRPLRFFGPLDIVA
jgi:hypothetical protein